MKSMRNSLGKKKTGLIPTSSAYRLTRAFSLMKDAMKRNNLMRRDSKNMNLTGHLLTSGTSLRRPNSLRSYIGTEWHSSQTIKILSIYRLFKIHSSIDKKQNKIKAFQKK